MSKHTPGPWEIHSKLPPIETNCEDFDAHTVTIGRGDLVIAESVAFKFKDGGENRGYPRVGDFEENVCNARLIAAAPDLLAALIDVVGDDETLQNPWRVAARAAIAKATGVGQ